MECLLLLQVLRKGYTIPYELTVRPSSNLCSARQWVAASVRVLIVRGSHHDHYNELLKQVLSALTGLVSINLPYGATIPPACSLPCLRHVDLRSHDYVPFHLADNITHFSAGSSTAFSKILQMKEKFRRLTHLMITFGDTLILRQTSSFFPEDTEQLDLLQAVVNTDARVVVPSSRKSLPPDWRMHRLLIFDESQRTAHYSGFLKDGDIGFWDLADRFLQEGQ
ncbi:hypothetical protein DL96DRAFT_1763081 [Flagelloscypha sp. PMI_526]|nr:hypothetical protein DL96DRAFT_1763081 [Flagelloscypha sp. PMI_526]